MIKIYLLIIFLIVYIFVIFEEFIKIKKSKVTIFGSTIIWVIIFLYFDDKKFFSTKIKEFILDYSELFLFLFVAMIYINTIKSFGLLNNIKIYFLKKKYSYKKIFWITGGLSFILSPLADNLTTALIMCSVILTIEKKDKNFINLSCINIVIASNAGGVFSPFGDVTTLMIWQKGLLEIKSFFYIFIPAIVTFFVPAFFISLNISSNRPIILQKSFNYSNINKYSISVIFLFIFTIILTAVLQTFLKIPAIIGMMTGLGFLQLFEYFNNIYNKFDFYVYKQIHKIEWETLIFFYGIILCVGGLSAVGLLNDIAYFFYDKLGYYLIDKYKFLPANILIGLFSSVIDNIPITFAVINMNINMSEGQWLLVTFTTGVGGSILSIGSAAGIALMCKANKFYTFFSHLKYTWAILLGYFLGIFCHIFLNNTLFI